MLKRSMRTVVQYSLMVYYGGIVMTYHLLEGTAGPHVYQRFLILTCDNVIPEEKRNKNQRKELLAEKDITVSVAVQFLLGTIANGYTFTESKRTKQNREDYRIRNNSLEYFLKECCELNQGRTEVSTFKWRYKNWCFENKLTPERPNDISKILTEQYNVIKLKSNTDYYNLTIK